MNLPVKRYLRNGLPVVACCALISSIMPPASGQVAGADQGIFSDEEQMLRINNAQIGMYQQQKAEAEKELADETSKNAQYRLYAEKRVAELSKGTASGAARKEKNDSTQISFFNDWLKRDAAYKVKQQAYVDQLQATIQNLQRSQRQTLSNLQSDITAMRGSVQDKKDSEKFNQMMQINYFNELQSEMGPYSWRQPPGDGTYWGAGGWGPGGYGYGPGGGRRYYW